MVKAKKQITLDDLAGMMNRRFDEVENKFDEKFNKQDKMNEVFVERFDKIDADMKDIKTNSDIRLRLAQVERKVGIK